MCEKVADALTALSARYDLEVRVLDIRDDPKLHDRYWSVIPVVQIDGKDVFDARDLGPMPDYMRKMELLVRPPSS